MIDRLQIPPIRTRLDEGAGQPAGLNAATGRTAKEWYLFWSNSGDQINTNRDDIANLTGVVDRLVEVGTHAQRPTEMPEEGALYVESDRGNVLYQSQDGKWRYVAGTMLGTLSPDQRPAGLGVNDTGFQFRATDAANAQRTFYWSGTAWIETTATFYGTHAARPAASTVPVRALYVETDRGNVIYQNQSGAWKYAAGQMLGTLSPDQRPTDLGANDTGFRFQATDVVYSVFYWSGSAWVDTTAPANTYQLARGSSSPTLTTTATLLPGATLTLAKAGRYSIRGVFDFAIQGTGDLGQPGIGWLQADGVTDGSAVAVFISPSGPAGLAGGRGTVAQEWLYMAPTTGKVVQILVSKGGGTGTSVCVGTSSMISATWISP